MFLRAGGFRSLVLPYTTRLRPLPTSLLRLEAQVKQVHTQSRLRYMEKQANARPNDAQLQARFLSAILPTHPDIVVERVLSNKFANNSDTKSLFNAAVQRPNNTNNNTLKEETREEELRREVEKEIARRNNSSQTDYSSDDTRQSANSKRLTLLMARLGLLVSGLSSLAFLGMLVLMAYVLKETLDRTSIGGAGKKDQIVPLKSKVHFSDVKGAVEAKKELQSVVGYLRDPYAFTRLGGKMPSGILLVGPPGNGKTLLAKAVAGEAGVPFFHMPGSAFDEVFVGVGAKRIRALFEIARENAPAIIFIDEIDAIAARSTSSMREGASQTLNQLLVELDGFNSAEGVTVIAATNLPQKLDSALLRPGRLERVITVPNPDLESRVDILTHYVNRVKLEATGSVRELAIQSLALGTSGRSGADLESIVNTAAIHAAKERKQAVQISDLEYARERLLLGGEASTRRVPFEVRKCTAWHEAGHTLVSYFTPHATKPHKVTIVPRGQSLGMTLYIPTEQDTMQQSKQQMLARLDSLLAGNIAEEMLAGPEGVTSGAVSDFESATNIARHMVGQYGMTSFGVMTQSKASQGKVDELVQELLAESQARVRKLMHERRVELETLAKALLQYGTLDEEEIRLVLDGAPLASLQKHRLTQRKQKP